MEKFTTPLEAFNYWVQNKPDQTFLRQPINREFIDYTYAEVDQEVRKVASGLKAMGLAPGKNIAVLSKNCAHWVMADLAIMMAGCVSVPIYPTLGAEAINILLSHSESAAIFIGKLDEYEKQKPGINNLHQISTELYGIKEEYSWEKLVKENKPLDPAHHQTPEELMTIMYTSGTTGTPKGVMHKAGSFAQVVNTGIENIPLPENPRYFSYLPMSHIAERMGIEISSIFRGATVSFPESLDTFAEDLASVQPHTFFGVPRIWQKFREKILEKISQKKLDRLFSLPLIGGLVKKRIRKKLGLNESRASFSGAAPISIQLLEWFQKLGITIYQAYGMTEDCIFSHFNLPGQNKPGTVGKPLPGAISRLSEEEEIQVKSECLMLGYFKEPEKTKEVFTEDGFLKTGDTGEFDHDGYLTITGRLKDQFKTDKGKYINPAPVEMLLLKNTYIDQVCLVGAGITQPIALIIPSEEGRSKKKAQFEKSLLETIDAINPTLEKHEKIEKAVIMKENWSVDNGLMTPTMKVKRNRVEAIHQNMYPSWFEHNDRVVYEE